MKRTSHGMILGGDGQKMSKSRGNVINPDDVIKEYGADTLRLYEMFIGDFEKTAPWSASSIKGCKRFLDRVWGLQEILSEGSGYRGEMISVMHKTIKKVSGDIESLKFNTAIAAMMSLVNDIYASGSCNKAELETLLILLNPFAPHISEEMYEKVFGKIISKQEWVSYDEKLCADSSIEIAVQINGKVRARITVPAEAGQDEALASAKSEESIKEALNGREIIKELYVKGRLVNIVIK